MFVHFEIEYSAFLPCETRATSVKCASFKIKLWYH